MDENSQIQRVEQSNEDKALQEWKKTKSAPIPLALSLKMYELYLNNYSLEDIWRVNGEKFPLGAIVDAKIRYKWDERKDIQLANLFNNIEKKVIRVKNESISMLADLLAAAHKIWGDRVAKFLQDGDISVLEGLDPSSFKNYKEILSMLQVLTNNNSKNAKDIKIDGTVSHIHSIEKTKIGSGDAANLLKLFDDAEIIDGK